MNLDKMTSDEKLNLILTNQQRFDRKFEEIMPKSKQVIEWFSVSSVAIAKKLTSDAVRKQLKNGDFEESVDFKYDGSKILVNQGAIERIQRRRSLNG